MTVEHDPYGEQSRSVEFTSRSETSFGKGRQRAKRALEGENRLQGVFPSKCKNPESYVQAEDRFRITDAAFTCASAEVKEGSPRLRGLYVELWVHRTKIQRTMPDLSKDRRPCQALRFIRHP